MFNQIPVTAYEVFYAFLLALVLIFVGLMLFKCIWLSQTEFCFPRGDYDNLQETSPGSDLVRSRGLCSYFKILFTFLLPLDADYWMNYVGFDGKLSSLSLLLHALHSKDDCGFFLLFRRQSGHPVVDVHLDHRLLQIRWGY